jgi:hypothetical protein
MTYYKQKLAAQQASADQAEDLAGRSRDWLVSRDIIGPEPDTPTPYGDDIGHPPGPDAARATDSEPEVFDDLDQSPVELITERTVFYSRWGEQTCSCPECGTEQPFGEITDVIDDWYNGDDDALYVCESCTESFHLLEADFEPSWGFGDFGLIFTDWPGLTDEFVEELESQLNQPLVLAYEEPL